MAAFIVLDGMSFVRRLNTTKPKELRDYDVIVYKLNKKQLRLLVADDEQKWTKGLMYQRELHGFDGMIFKFPKKEIRSFWNKNTYLLLDIVWISGDTVVGYDRLPPITESKTEVIISSSKPVDTVIELVKNK